MQEPKPTGLSFALFPTTPDRGVGRIARMMGPSDEMFFTEAGALTPTSAERAKALEKALNDHVVLLYAYEELRIEDIDSIRSAVTQRPQASYTLQTKIPSVSGQMWITPDVRIVNRKASPGEVLHLNVRPQWRPMGSDHVRLVQCHRLTAALEWTESEPNSPSAWNHLAVVYLASHNFVRAEACARHAQFRSIGEEAIESNAVLLQCLIENRRYEEVLDQYRKDSVLMRPSRSATLCAARANMALGRYPQALELARRAQVVDDPLYVSHDSSLSPSLPEIIQAEAHLGVGHTQASLDILGNLSDSDLRSPEVAVLLSEVLFAVGEYAGAKTAAEHAQYARTTKSRGLRVLGLVALETGDTLAARKFLQQAWESGDHSPELMSHLVTASTETETLDPKDSLDSAFLTQFSLGPTELLHWGHNFERGGDDSKASHCFSEAIQAGPKDPHAYFALGTLLTRTGEYQDAAQILEQGLQLDSEQSEMWLAHAHCLEMLGLAEQSKFSFAMAHKLASSNSRLTHAKIAA